MEQIETPTPVDRTGFAALGLPARILQAVEASGYTEPTPVQARCIPALMEGRDVLGQAQTGTGKTAAFALPLLARLSRKERKPQVLVLTPTRELAIQVAESFEGYGDMMPGFQVLPIYGGSSYTPQFRALERGVHVVVGTPGRVMDHIRRGSLQLDGLRSLVLDEADEMLKMGFLEDVQWILEHIPAERQTALFSATMPPAVQRIAEDHLGEPEVIRIEARSRPADTIRQRILRVHGPHKLEALTRVLEAEPTEGVIAFVRTKNQAAEVADALEARGLSAAALSGDVTQANREKIVDKLRSGRIDIVVATDVAARGLDVERISHVVNYDMPMDAETYVHRIGRTGRAGRTGEAILFVKPKEQRTLRLFERAVGAPMEPMRLPSPQELSAARVERFRARIADSMQADDLGFFRELVEEMLAPTSDDSDSAPVDPVQLAAALARMAQGDTPLKPQSQAEPLRNGRRDQVEWQENEGNQGARRAKKFERGGRTDRFDDAGPRRERGPRPKRELGPPERGMERFRVQVGYRDGAAPGPIVGAICNETGLEGKHIGRIEIYESYATVDLPSGMPEEIFDKLQRTRVNNRALRLSKERGPAHTPAKFPSKKGKHLDRDAAPREQSSQDARQRVPMSNRERFEAGL